MPGSTKIAVLACLCAFAPAGCGSNEEGTIPASNSEQLIGLLNGIEQNVAGGNCDIAREQADEFVAAVNQLPAEVDDEVKGGIQDAAGRLRDLSEDPGQCEDTTGTTDLDELEPDTSPETTEPTTTETETDTTTTTDETDEEPPTDGDDGGEDGGGGGDSGPDGGGTSDGEGEVTIEPPAEDEPSSGGIGGDQRRSP